jgi:DNA-binding NarL/FixJ family response regulator
MTAGNSAAARVLLVDDHPAVRQGVALLLAAGRHTVRGEAHNRLEALARLDTDAFDVALLDLSLGDESGLELIADLEDRGIPTLIYSMHEDPETIARAFRRGALGYVTKRENPVVLLEAVAAVMAGRRYVSPQAAQSLASQALIPNQSDPEEGLSDRERQILVLMGRGETTVDIATVLAISVRTVETYYTRIIEKLQLSGMKGLRKHAISRHRQR